ALGEGRLIDWKFDDLFAAHEGHLVVQRFFRADYFLGFSLEENDLLGELGVDGINGHVVAVGDAVVIIEAVPGRQKRRQMAEVPFADDTREVAEPAQQAGDSGFIRVEAVLVAWKHDGRYADALVMPARHERGARARTDRAAGVKAGEAQ